VGRAAYPFGLRSRITLTRIEERLGKIGQRARAFVTSKRDRRTCRQGAGRGISESEEEAIVSLAAAPSVRAEKAL